MKAADFDRLVRDEFGVSYAETLLTTHVLGSLDATAAAALSRGVAPRRVWEALCDDFDVPQSRRFGREVRRRPGPD